MTICEFDSLLDENKLNQLKNYTIISNQVEGIIVEIGVYRGGSASIIAKHKKTEKNFFCFDSFEGLPKENQEFDNFHKEKDFDNTDFESVKTYLEKFDNTFVLKGFFPQENSSIIKNQKISMAHIDVDLYQCYLDCLEFIYPRMSIGGIMVFDDYKEKTCLGAKKAIDEFFKNKRESLIWPINSQISVVKQAF